ncbi:hypothetical protein Efla_002693 [Eimeria flavescens]
MVFHLFGGCRLAVLLLLCPFSPVQQQPQQQLDSSSSSCSSSIVLAEAYEASAAAAISLQQQQQQQQEQQQQEQQQQKQQRLCEEVSGGSVSAAAAAAAAAAAGIDLSVCPSPLVSPAAAKAAAGAAPSSPICGLGEQQLQQRLTLTAATLHTGAADSLSAASALGLRVEPLAPYAKVLRRIDKNGDTLFQQQETLVLLQAALKETLHERLELADVSPLLQAIDIHPQQQQQQQQEGTLEVPQMLRLLQLVAGGETLSSGALEGLLAAGTAASSSTDESPAGAAGAAAGEEGQVGIQLDGLLQAYKEELFLFFAEGLPYLQALHRHSTSVRHRLLLLLHAYYQQQEQQQQEQQQEQQQQQQQQQQQAKDVIPPPAHLVRSRAFKIVEQQLPHLKAAALRDSSSSSSSSSSSRGFVVRLDVLESLLSALLQTQEAAFLFAFADSDGDSGLSSSEFFYVLLLQQLHAQQLVQAAAATATLKVFADLLRRPAVLETPWASGKVIFFSPLPRNFMLPVMLRCISKQQQQQQQQQLLLLLLQQQLLFLLQLQLPHAVWL